MKRYIKYLLILILSICSIGLFSALSERKVAASELDGLSVASVSQDTLPRYPVKKTQITKYDDLEQTMPIDLRTPSNIKTEIEYDPRTNLYIFRTKLGDKDIVTPFSLSSDEYVDYSLRQSMSKYFRGKNALAFEQGGHSKDDFVLKDVKVNMGSLERVFGPGGVKFKANGYVEAKMGMKNTKVNNPALSQRNRNKTIFEFDQDIQVNVSASVGEKIDFGMNYDTKAAFDFDSKKIKLAYEGKEDEIVKRIEAGNVSMATTNSLINGGTALFGINTELQFGKLRVNAVVSQQESETRSINTQGSVQNNEYEFKADQYEENRHFFLGHYFRDNYNRFMSRLPAVLSPVTNMKIEVWITNKRNNFDQARNIVAFADLSESDSIKNNAASGGQWTAVGTKLNPYNEANDLYTYLKANPTARDKSQVNSVLGAVMESGLDFEKVESARLLTSSEYSFNPQMGYISLTSALQADEVLAVAYSYQINGRDFQVGEFAADIVDNYDPANNKSGALYLKMLKPVSMSPRAYTWHLMMKNVYSIGANNIQKEGFRLQISYQSDTLGAYINYIPDGAIKNEPLLRVMGLDRLDARDKARANGDGQFDYLEGYTVRSDNGRIYFPVVEPFGRWLAEKISNPAVAEKYVYQELYDSTKTVAQQVAEKNKFKLHGKYRGSNNSSAEISLNATNVPQGSVRVTAAGVNLMEGVDYIVDYIAGTVTIINQNLIDSSTPVQVSLEDRTFSMQQKTLLGLNLSYDFTKNFNMGATIMHLYEKPLSTKTTIGGESVKNTLWGLNTSYRTQSQWLTNMIDKIPFVNATQPSQISFNGEFAQMIAGHYTMGDAGGYSYLDDFETSESRIDLKNPYSWTLSATPSDRSASALFPEGILSNDTTYGMNRALLSWFYIDRIFTRKGSALTPQHIKNDKDQLSNHFVREIFIKEIYPKRDIAFNEAGILPVLNLSFYPTERGPYNLDVTRVNLDGSLMDPKDRWGGITRKMDVRDFEASNVEYIEFWLMDPFVYSDTATIRNPGGDLYINLGEISEDVLKDGKKFFENGLPLDGDPTKVDVTVWGKVPKRQSIGYAFENEAGADGRKRQDVGLNGLSTEEEFTFPTYANYLTAYRARLSATALTELMQNPFSALNDPAGDTYQFYRGKYYDENETSILDRYKYYNGTEGNSPVGDTGEKYSTASRTVPDVEDIDQDNTMNENESYYQYKISIKSDSLEVGKNHIVDSRRMSVPLANGTDGAVTWYQFKIPIRGGRKIGAIQGFKSIRFMRMFMTDFEQPTFLRFATLQLVRGEWRQYENTLNVNNTPPGVSGKLDVSTVNIEENGNREPVTYILPPGLSRVLDANQTQLLKENEQSISLKVLELDAQDARGIYKNTNYDLRRYKRIQMFTHAEELINGLPLDNGDLTVFMRLGSDYKNNYYEYEIPLSVTPHGQYSSDNKNDRVIVWPANNMFDFSLSLLKDVKLKRNAEKRKAGSTITYATLFTDYDPEKPANKISVIGNPSLAEVNVIMIGVRNNSRFSKSGEVWINELRLTDFDEQGGWAAKGNLNIALSDIATIDVSAHKETVGFGALDQSLLERRSDDYTLYNVALNVDLGRFLPEKAKVSFPLYYSQSTQEITPEYDPFDTDVKLKESLRSVNTRAEKDSIKSLAVEKITNKSLNINNVKVNIQSKTPMPYDPANFSFSYSYNESETKNPTMAYDVIKDYKGTLNYNYSPVVKTWEPFGSLTSKSGSSKFAKSIGLNYVPSNIAFNSNMTRYYSETLIRDIDSYAIGASNDANFLTWSQSFYWDRDFNMNWDLTRNLRMSFQSGTRAEIEEPYLQVNKDLNRAHYEIWKDSVWSSIKDFGTPLSYRQIARITYQLPTRSIPALDWINSSASYTGNYQWDRGAEIDSMEIGNTIMNNMTLDFNNRFDLVALYKKSSYLKKVSDRFDTRRSTRPGAQQNQREKPKVVRKKRFTQDIVLIKDSVYTLKHGLDTKKLDIVAKSEGKAYKLKYKRLDNNTILITNKDSAVVQLSIMEKDNKEDASKFWQDVADYSVRGLMSVRSVSVNYSNRRETSISGFRPKVGDLLGQKKNGGQMAPGVGFAFGVDGGEEYIKKSLDRNWLVTVSDANISPAIFNKAEKLEIRAQIEPIKGLRIELNANREDNRRTEYQFMNDGMPRQLGGSFSMTTISLSSAFESGNAKNGYKSKSFDKFLANRSIIQDRLQAKYGSGTLRYPNAGFIKNDLIGVGNTSYNPALGSVNPNSSDVLIPAFISAYTGKGADKVSLSAFPSLAAILPNWTIAYDGLMNIPFIKKQFKTLRFNHSYSSFYQVGSYNSHTSWVDAGDGLGFIRDVLSGNPIPSSPYNVGSVTIAEMFSPLFGMEGTLNNNMSLTGRYNRTRTLNLNTSSYQIIESIQKEWVVGVGYRINDFNELIGLGRKGAGRAKKGTSETVNNDLNLKADISHRTTQALIRKIEENFTQATSGTTILTLKVSADYTLSKSVTLRAFFDRIMNEPLITTSGYPTTTTSFGISLKFTLLQ